MNFVTLRWTSFISLGLSLYMGLQGEFLLGSAGIECGTSLSGGRPGGICL